MRRLLIFVFCLSGLTTPSVGSDDAGTRSPFAFGVGARELALGGSAVSLCDGATAPYWNPSRLALVEQIGVSGFHCRLFEGDVAYQYLGLVIPTLDWGSIGFGVFRLGIDGIEERDQSNMLVGDFSDNRLAFYMAYGRSFDQYDVGAALTVEQHSLADYNASSSPGLMLSVGRRFNLGPGPFSFLDIAINARNVLRPEIKLADAAVSYPFELSTGLGLTLHPESSGRHAVMLSADAVKTENNQPLLAGGVEYDFSGLLQIRGGWRDGNAALGAGIKYAGIGFDYALVERDLGSLHLFTLTTSFGAPISERRRLRAEQRERSFNEAMAGQLNERNRELVDKMVVQGGQQIQENQLTSAVESFDRALFVARGAGIDTTAICRLLLDARTRLDGQTRTAQLHQYLDSAQTRLNSGDYLGGQYYARLAQGLDSTSVPAGDLIARSEKAIEQEGQREQFIQTQLGAVDSLLAYGRLGEAQVMVRTLDEIAPNNPLVTLAVKKVRFDSWRDRANKAFDQGNYPAALSSIDSALTLFPGHQSCLDFRARCQQAVRPVATPTVASGAAPLSRELQKEVEAAYRLAQAAFTQGDLQGAIAGWETVERLAPGYQSVREYLVNSYKFLGVELYGQNRLPEALDIWRKAATLAPQNVEIAAYVKRTENEIQKLKAMSYDAR
jgi:tetratricopeptide (TPR) repeat protein